MQTRQYEQPVVTDYGSLSNLTKAVLIGGPEDGANKNQTEQHHSSPMLPGIN